MVFRADAALGYAPGKEREAVGRVGPAVGRRRVIGPGDERQIPQLVTQSAGTALRGLLKLLRRDAGGFQLVQRAKKKALLFRRSPGGGIDPEAGAYIIKGQSHTQKPAPLVQIPAAPPPTVASTRRASPVKLSTSP